MAQIPASNCSFCDNAVAVLYCARCHQILCVSCKQNVHDKVPFLKDHEVVNTNKEGNRVFRPIPVCEIHNSSFRYYCSKCDCLTCEDCMTSIHNEHRTLKIKNISDDHRKRVNKIIDNLKTKVEINEKKMKMIDTEHLSKIDIDCESYISKVEKTAGELNSIIDRNKRIYRTIASDFKEIEKIELNKKRSFFQRLYDESADRILKFKNLLQETHDVLFFTDWKNFKTDMEISNEENDQPVMGPNQMEVFDKHNFTLAVIEAIDEQVILRLKESQNEVTQLQEEKSTLIDDIRLKQNEITKLTNLSRKFTEKEKKCTDLQDENDNLQMELKQRDIADLSKLKEQEQTVVRLTEDMGALKDELEEKQEQINNQSKLLRGLKKKERIVTELQDENNKLKTELKQIIVHATKKQTNFPSESFSKSDNPSGGVSKFMVQSYSTPEGMTIKVYVGNILKLDVECIVNAANESLSHGGGVAAVISEAAGYKFEQESADYVRRYGTLPVGTCYSTSAGKLHYKYVIHTVGPRWYEYEKKRCARNLKQSIVCCFEEAEKLQLNSIAFPPISEGLFGLPKEVYVTEYKNAVYEFSRNRKDGAYLKEIHFIDNNLGVVSLIHHEFNTIFQQSSKSSSPTSPVGKQYSRRSISSGSNDGKFQQGASVRGNRSNRFNKSTNGKIGVFVVKQKLKLEVKTGDITKCEIDAIVCPQDELLMQMGRIAVEVQKVGGSDYRDDLLKLGTVKKTRAKRMNAPRKCPWKYIIQAVPPKWNHESTRDQKGFEQNLKDTVFNILNATKHSRIKTIAVPLMGIAEKNETPVETFAEQFARAVLKQIEEKDFTVEEIHVVVQDMTVVKKIVAVLDTKETEGIRKVLKSGHRSSPERSEEAMVVNEEETGDENGGCCICMGKLISPKKLACGHVFCTDCIEHQLKYKPSCPQCGQIHGLVTGTQPDGRINITTKKYSLPGYPGTNTIEIEYIIHSGSQRKEHPTPGRYFDGITRTAFLPETKKGKMVLKLLEVAFNRKLVFTIGTSTTTGKTGVVIWNDIHHKTNPKPYTQFGYPDDTYLDRVLEELAVKGVTEKDLKD